MGSSGAGKTTFMNTLAQRNIADLEVKGEISLNGIRSTPENIQKLSGETQFLIIFSNLFQVISSKKMFL